jgi:hypothetical protein
VGLSLLIALTGCDQSSLLKKLTSPQDESIALNYIDQLRQSNFVQIEQDADPSIDNADLPRTLVTMAALFPKENPLSVKIVGVHTFRNSTRSTSRLTFEYEFASQWVLAEVKTQTVDGTATLAGMTVTPVADSLEHINRFTLRSKGSPQYLMLFLVALSLLISTYAFVLCLRTKMRRRKKWLWSILTLVGVGKLGINWTTGESFFNLFWIQVPTAQAFNALFSPWLVMVSLPLGAILFLFLRRGFEVESLNTPDILPSQMPESGDPLAN